jgi:hypothetical protein
MFDFFRKGKRTDPRGLEQVIYDVAEHQADKDFQLLYELMAERQVFAPVDMNTLPVGAIGGETVVTSDADRIRMRTVLGPNNLVLVPCATCADSALLKGGHVGMDWFNFLEMFLKLDDSFYGVLLQGRTSWVVFDRERTKYILAKRSAKM